MGDADSASAKSYESDIKGNESISVINTDCKSGSFGGGDIDKNPWIAMPDSAHMLVNWNDGIILTLSPVIAGTPPTPSFSCAKAKSPSEKAICADYELSSWDKSVNSAWKSAQAGAISVGDKELKARIVASQKEWLKKRHACEDDVSCIRKSMVERLDALSDMTDAQ
ncbi:lysozyme inhibitor LprI family protein [Erwinia sp. E_sp_B04_7]|uniref:lysozyme inhibitor LprI family protein n=1 Tax=unclassified Erwinia TaxID=2622719 RepID=UPI0030D448CC